MLQYEENATLLKAEAKAYDFQGKQGISYSARFILEGEVLKFKIKDKTIFEKLEAMPKMSPVTIVLELSSYNEKPVFSLVAIKG